MNDHMKEAERLLAAVEAKAFQLARGVCSFDESREARAALLAHIQRGAVPDGWQVVPKEPTEEMLTAGSHASMQHLLDCINDPVRYRKVGSEEITRKTHASRYRTMLAAAPAPDELGDINVVDIAQAADATRETAPAPAEVPMPEPDLWLKQTSSAANPPHGWAVLFTPNGDASQAYLSSSMNIYGDAREAAGYARAANWLRASAGKHAGENGYHEHDTGSFVFASREAEEWNNSVLELADEMEAALRGEVK